MNGNPFHHLRKMEQPEWFYNRRSEVTDALGLLREKGNVEVTGPRRIGKTWFLRYICHPTTLQKHDIDPRRNIYVYIDCQHRSIQQKEDQVYQRLLERIEDAAWQAEIDLAPESYTGHATATKIEQMLKDLHRQGRRTILLLDEFGTMAQNPNLNVSFFNHLRSLSGADEFNVTYVTASATSLVDLAFERESFMSSPFFNIFQQIRLELFSEQDSLNLIEHTLAKTNTSFPNDLLELVLEVGGGHPLFLQMAGHHAFKLAVTTEELMENQHEAFLESVYEEATRHFEYYWRQLDQQDQDVLADLASLWRDEKHQDAIKRLRDACLVIKSDDKYDYFSFLFQGFVQDQKVKQGKREPVIAPTGGVDLEKDTPGLQGVESALAALEIEREKGMIDIGRYLRLKREHVTLKAELEGATKRTAQAQVPDQQDHTQNTDHLIHILHLSDIHLGTINEARQYRTQLLTDLINELEVKSLQYLVISGDIADYSTSTEYNAAFELIDGLVKRFKMDYSQVVIVPGNHDLNWDISEKAYSFVPKRKLPDKLSKDRHIPAGDVGALLRDDKLYSRRFANFARFYKRVYEDSKEYPLDPTRQADLIQRPDDRMLFLALNSCWEIDHHFCGRASINMQALSLALDYLQEGDYDDWLKVAVWHHPVRGKETMNADFLELLTVHGFQVCMHGHIHEASEGFYKHDDARGIHIIGAGTFGAPAKEQVSGIPLQYNLLVLNPKACTVIVETRKKEKPDGAWSADARWGDKRKNPQSRYTIQLKAETFSREQ